MRIAQFCQALLSLDFMLMMLSLLFRRTASAWVPSLPLTTSSARNFHNSRPALLVLKLEVDDQGRRVRRRSQKDEPQNNGWDDFDPTDDWASTPDRRSGSREPRSTSAWKDYDTTNRNPTRGGWDDFTPPARKKRSFPAENRGVNRGDRRERGGRPDRTGRNNRSEEVSPDRKINMKALEGTGLVHLYGLSSVLNALQANKRDFTRPEDTIDLDSLEGADREHEIAQRERKPEAQFSPWLFVQEQKGQIGRSGEKSIQAEKVEELAAARGIPIASVDKGVLNTLSGNRPHQGYVLRCGKLFFESLNKIPHPDEDSAAPSMWLVLDEVVDPQNLGALLRSAYFLGGSTKVGILVCAKNSAPPSPTVSAASAGALELVDLYSTSNLPRTLAAAESDGFRIVGASASVPRDLNVPLYELQEISEMSGPTILVLGSEGHGLRSLVAKSCTEFVKVPGAVDAGGVDSLNVSVTGGILLWHFLKDTTK